MKILAVLGALFIAMGLCRASGHPVYGLLKANVYDIPYGTGFTVLYKGHAFLVTNWHVCRQIKKAVMAKNEETGVEQAVSIIASFPNLDLCLMTPPTQTGLTMGQDVGYKYPVYTAGYPENSRSKMVLAQGYVVNFVKTSLDFGRQYDCPATFRKGEKTCEQTYLLEDTTMPGAPGCSGSPVLGAQGTLVGIVNSTNDGTLSYIPVSTLAKLLESLEHKGVAL